MIKVALKHWIFEVCINVLFSFTEKNFKRNIPRDVFALKKGDTFKSVVSYDLDMGDGRGDGDYSFIDCVVTRESKYSLDFRGWYVEGNRYCNSVWIKYWSIKEFRK